MLEIGQYRNTNHISKPAKSYKIKFFKDMLYSWIKYFKYLRTNLTTTVQDPYIGKNKTLLSEIFKHLKNEGVCKCP